MDTFQVEVDDDPSEATKEDQDEKAEVFICNSSFIFLWVCTLNMIPHFNFWNHFFLAEKEED